LIKRIEKIERKKSKKPFSLPFFLQLLVVFSPLLLFFILLSIIMIV